MGKKTTQAEREQRITDIHNLIVSGCNRPMLLQHGAKKWGSSIRQTDDYIAHAYKLIQTESAATREVGRDLAAARMDAIYLKAMAQNKLDTAINASREKSKLFGYYAPPPPQVYSITGLDEKQLIALSNAIRSHGLQPSDVFLEMIQEIALADREKQ